MRTTHAPIHTAVATATVTLLFIILSGVGSVAWAQETAPALTPADATFTLNGNPSAGEICGEVEGGVGLTAYADGVLNGSSWNGGQEDPDLTVDRTDNVGDRWTIHWTSPDPLDAVIIRVRNTFHVYRYTPSTDADSDLVVLASNNRMTFCIADPEAPEIESLGTVCEREAAKDTAEPIVSFAGPFEIVDEEVTESPKDGATLDFIQSSSSHDTTVAFTAPFPVVMVIIRSSPDVAIALDEPATTGSVAFDLNPGGEVMLCGLAVETLVSGPTNPPPPPDPTVEVQAPVELLPVQIASGEGPPMRTTLMLVVFVLLAMASSITLLLRSRSD